MFPMRINYYNSDILMLHKFLLLSLEHNAKSPDVRRQVSDMLKLYEKNVYRSDIPYEMISWPNNYFGIAISDEKNHALIESAIELSWDDNIPYWGVINDACGFAFLNGNLELAYELKNLHDTYPNFVYPLKRKDILQVISAKTLSYLLTFMQSKKLEGDSQIIYFDGEKYLLLNTAATPPARIIESPSR